MAIEEQKNTNKKGKMKEENELEEKNILFLRSDYCRQLSTLSSSNPYVAVTDKRRQP